jgi:hypothetical protein
MKFEPARIRAPLLTPIRLGQIPVGLDKLLWHSLFLRMGEEQGALKQLDSLLDRQGQLFRASTLRFGTYPDNTLIATTTTTLGVMIPEKDLDPTLFHWKKWGGKYTKIVINGGPYKNRLTKNATHYAPEVTWDVVGDAKRICQLLNFYVTAVGRDANRGLGAVGRFSSEPLHQDTSWFDETGQLARVLPASIVEEKTKIRPPQTSLIQGCLTPPYRGPDSTVSEPCVAPARVRKIRLTPNV